MTNLNDYLNNVYNFNISLLSANRRLAEAWWSLYDLGRNEEDREATAKKASDDKKGR